MNKSQKSKVMKDKHDRKIVYDYVYAYLRKHNKKNPQYYDAETINNIASKKFGKGYDVQESSYDAFRTYYESPEFMKKL